MFQFKNRGQADFYITTGLRILERVLCPHPLGAKLPTQRARNALASGFEFGSYDKMMTAATESPVPSIGRHSSSELFPAYVKGFGNALIVARDAGFTAIGPFSELKKEMALEASTAAGGDTLNYAEIAIDFDKGLCFCGSGKLYKNCHYRSAPSAEHDAIMAIPGMAAAVQNILNEQAARVVDEPVPALGGLTPRECMKTENGKAKVIHWLETYWEGESARAHPQMDSTVVRRALGLREIPKKVNYGEAPDAVHVWIIFDRKSVEVDFTKVEKRRLNECMKRIKLAQDEFGSEFSVFPLEETEEGGPNIAAHLAGKSAAIDKILSSLVSAGLLRRVLVSVPDDESYELFSKYHGRTDCTVLVGYTEDLQFKAREWSAEDGAREGREMLRAQFKEKFGRDWKHGDPILYDPDSSTPVAITPAELEAFEQGFLQDLRAAGVSEASLYAFQKTGGVKAILRDIEHDDVDPKLNDAYLEALREFDSQHKKQPRRR